VDISWKRLGVPASVAATLRSVFPHIAEPTKTQARLIPAILSGKDVLLKDHTETGKCVETHVSVDVQHPSDKSTELQVIWLNLGLAQRFPSMEVRTRIPQKTHKPFCLRIGHSPAQKPRPTICMVDPGHYRIQDPDPPSRAFLCGPGLG